MALELEELRREQAGYEQQIQTVDETMKAIREQIHNMASNVAQNKVTRPHKYCKICTFLKLRLGI